MGKQKRVRQKLHIAAQREKTKPNEESSMEIETLPLMPIASEKDNLFSGININLGNLNTKLQNDDTQSVKSYKSVKSEKGAKILPKKEKLKLRREVLMKKIDYVNQMKKELKLRNKRKKTAVIGDTNPLHDALMESLIQMKPKQKTHVKQSTKKKAIDKSTKQRKNLISNINIIKSTLRNKEFKKNPLEAMSQHIKTVVESERQKSKSK